MMHTIQQKFQHSSFDINRSMRSIASYAWLVSGVLFVCYLYFIGAITFSVVKQRALAQETKQLISTTSVEEMRYLVAQKSLTATYATTVGFVPSSTIAYTEPMRAFAWNVGR